MGRPSLTSRGSLNWFSNFHRAMDYTTITSGLGYNLTLDYSTINSRLQDNRTLDCNNTTNHLNNDSVPFASWVLFVKFGLPVPSFVPWLLLGSMIQVVLSLTLASFLPDSISSSSSRSWKWKATFTARVSAGISGLWAVVALYQSPSMYSDLMFTYSPSAQHLVIFSLGVHIAEVVDMLINLHPSMLMLHHILVIICFTGALLTDKAIGFAVLSLVTEINAVFNKTRILHIITNTPKDSIEFIWNAYLNIFTFFIRILIIVWMNNQCFLYYGVLPLPFLLSCSAGLLIVNIWNLSVFRQLVQKDVFRKS